MNVLQHTRNELNLYLKENRPNRSYRDTLLKQLFNSFLLTYISYVWSCNLNQCQWNLRMKISTLSSMRSHWTIQNNLLSRTQEFFKNYPKIVVEVMIVRKTFILVITKKETKLLWVQNIFSRQFMVFLTSDNVARAT